MKEFSLLSMLSADTPKPKIVEAKDQPQVDKPEYQVYLLEGAEGSRKICIPVENVDSFDAFVNDNPETISNIDLMVEKFSAVVLA